VYVDVFEPFVHHMTDMLHHKVLVLAASCIGSVPLLDRLRWSLTYHEGCGFPVVAKKVKWLKIPPKIFFACKHFGTGVLIATAFVHVRPNQLDMNQLSLS